MTVEGAVNGQEAVELFEKSEPGYYSVILMDIMMPVLNGLDSTRKIRTLNRTDKNINKSGLITGLQFAPQKLHFAPKV